MKKYTPKPPSRVTKAPHPDRGSWSYLDCGHYQMAMHDEHTPMWLEVLRRCGYPGTVVVIDFEAYYDQDYSLRKDHISTIEYLMDERFEQTAVSIKVVDGAHPLDPFATSVCHVGEVAVNAAIKDLQARFGDNLERCTVVIQNARFDGMLMLKHHGITPKYPVDVLGLAMAWNTWSKNGLDALCRRFNLPSKGDTAQFKDMTFRSRWRRPKRGRRKIAPPPYQLPAPTDEQVRALIEYTDNDVEREWDLFTILLPLFSRPEVELPLLSHTLNMYYTALFSVDYDRAAELITEMEAELASAIEPTGLTIEQVRGGDWDERMLHALMCHAGGPYAHLLTYLKPAKNCKRGWAVCAAKADPEREELETHADPQVRALMTAKAAAGSWPNHIKRVKRIVAQCEANGGKLPVPLFYHGAHTGRWSGGEKINLQNLGSRGHPLVNAIREILIAPPGYELAICDLSAVEARGVAWIAGQWDLIEKFQNNEEIYCRFAEIVLDKPVGSLRKPKPSDPGPVFQALKFARNMIGKVGILGCGYGMGDVKAQAYAGGAIDLETATNIVNTYRSTYAEIVKFWKTLEKAFIYTTKYDQPVELPQGLRIHTEVEPNSKAKVTIITLPSGRELTYHNVSIRRGKWGDSIVIFNEKEHKRVHFWGGHLTENVVQALCRDALAEQILILAEKYPIPLHVHDEIITLVPEGQGEQVLAEMIQVMSQSPDWGPDLPLGAEGTVTKRYGDH